MSQDKMREEFERCAEIIWDDASLAIRSLWQAAWQASRAAIAIQLPPKSQPTSDKESEIAWHNVRNSTIDACARAVEAAGVRVEVKP